MSFGYYLGGWLVDRRPDFVTLSHLLAASAFFTLIVPLLQSAIDESFRKTDVVWGPIFASLLLFALPGCLLGSISPFAIRLISLLYADKRIGVSAGSIGMFSTLGSVVGTFSAGFLLIPQWDIKTIFLVTAIVLAFLATIGYIFFQSVSRKRALILNACILILLTVGLSISRSEMPSYLLFDQTTFYHRIRVFQKVHSNGNREKTLYLDTTVEGSQFEKSREIPIPYQRYWELVKVFCPEIKTAAFLGAGAYTMPESLLDAYPYAKVDVIEIDPKVVEVGYSFFRLKDYPQIVAVVDDARRYLNSSEKRYDFIFGDAYNGVYYIPSHLVTLEFFKLIKNRLSEKGVFMMNMISAIRGDKSKLFLSVVKTLGMVFNNIYVFALDPNQPTEAQNVIIAASTQKLRMKLDAEMGGTEKHRLEMLLSTYVPTRNYDISGAPLLTDSYNPVEYIVAKGLIR